MQAFLLKIVESPFFRPIILGLIIINAITLGMETSPTLMAEHGDLLHLVDLVILTIFVVEIAMRMVARGKEFWRDPWCIFDFLVVGVALLPHAGEFAVLRTLRVLRVLRLISMIPSMRRVVSALISSLSGVAAVASIMLVIFYVFSVIATTLFSQVHPTYFSTLGNTMLTLFQVMTLEDWAEIARPVIEQVEYAWLFFVSYIMISTFVILNLFIGVMVYAIQNASIYSGPDRRRATPEQKAALRLLEEQGFIDELKALRKELQELKAKQ